MKQVLVDLAEYLEHGKPSDIMSRTVDRFGSEEAWSVAMWIVSAFVVPSASAGRMFIDMESERGKAMCQWVLDEPALSELFDVRKDDIYFRKLPAAERKELIVYADASIERIAMSGVLKARRKGKKRK